MDSVVSSPKVGCSTEDCETVVRIDTVKTSCDVDMIFMLPIPHAIMRALLSYILLTVGHLNLMVLINLLYYNKPKLD